MLRTYVGLNRYPCLRATLQVLLIVVTCSLAFDGYIQGRTRENAVGGAGGAAGPRVRSGVAPNLAVAESSGQRDRIHLEVIEIGDAGPTIVGIGEGGFGAPPENALGEGFLHCHLGTGVDTNSHITGERYVFGPNLPIYLGGEYGLLFSGRWTGDGWYRPPPPASDGSVYFENQNHYWIPDPQDFGYDWWNWFNVYFYWATMPGDMQSLEGNWTAKWYDNGNNVCSKTYTVMYDLSSHVMCLGVQNTDPYDPLGIQYDFLVSDEAAYSWLRLDNFALNNSPDVQWKWYGPEGFYLENEYDIVNPGDGSWWSWFKTWSNIYIDGFYPASHPGAWYVDVYVKDYSGSYELKFTESFTIVAPTGACCFGNGSCTVETSGDCNTLGGTYQGNESDCATTFCRKCAFDGDCDDGDPCNGLETCVGGICQPGTPPNCDDGNPCTDDSCDPVVGCVNIPNTNSCNDGDACTTGDTCSGGMCAGGPPLDCDDGNPCTDDFCDSASGCINTPITPCCGNGVAEAGEDCSNCPADVQCPAGTQCIAGICELPSPADISGPRGGVPDGCVDAFDLGTMLGAWCSAVNDPNPPSPPCENCIPVNLALADISGAANVPDGCVDAFDLAKLLAEWCSVAGGNPCGTCFSPP